MDNIFFSELTVSLRNLIFDILRNQVIVRTILALTLIQDRVFHLLNLIFVQIEDPICGHLTMTSLCHLQYFLFRFLINIVIIKLAPNLAIMVLDEDEEVALLSIAIMDTNSM